MSFVKLPYPHMATNEVLDPERVNANFRALAHVVNGRLGAENLRRLGAGVSALECQKTSMSLYIPMPAGFAASTRVFRAPVNMTLVAVGVVDVVRNLSGNFVGELVYGPDAEPVALASLNPPGDAETTYWATRLWGTSIVANTELSVRLTFGTLAGIMLELRTYSLP